MLKLIANRLRLAAAAGSAGSVSGLQNRPFGFDSHRRLQSLSRRVQIARYWLSNPRKALAKLRGLSDADLIFGGEAQLERWRAELEASAFNKAYAAPDDARLVARQVVTMLRQDAERWKADAVAAKRALSDARRGK